MRCQYCNSEIPDNYSFCPNCGKSLNPEPSQTANGSGRKFCDNCGAPLEAGKPFCANCGKPVGENMQQNNPNSGMPPYPGSPVSQPVGKKKKTGLIVAIVIICLVLLAGGIGTAMYFLVFDDKDDKKTEEVTVSQDEDDNDEADITDEDEPEDDALSDDGDTYTDDSGSDTLSNGKFRDLDAFINSDLMQEQLGTQIAALEGTGISADVYADGDTLVYDFTIEDEAVASVMDKATLASSLQSQASTFEGVAAMLPAAIENIDDPAVVVRYLDPWGTEITSMEFTPD